MGPFAFEPLCNSADNTYQMWRCCTLLVRLRPDNRFQFFGCGSYLCTFETSR